MTPETVEILLIEDNPEHAELTLRALKRHHVTNHIHVLKDGAEAIGYLLPRDGSSPPPARLILLDLKLPKLDGLEVLRRVKGDARTRMIPVVVLTSSSEDKDLTECYRLGVNSYIVKPVDFQRFSEAARSVGFYWTLLNQVPRPVTDG
jgi:two-component system, response regulator